MREAFDPSNPAELLADEFRKEVAALAERLFDSPQYDGLDSKAHVAAFVAGVSTALIGVAFSQIRDEGRDDMMRFIRHYLPQAQEQAEAILDATGEC